MNFLSRLKLQISCLITSRRIKSSLSSTTPFTVAFLPGVDPSPIVITIFSGALYPAPANGMQISLIPANGSVIGVPPINLSLSPTLYPSPPVVTDLLDNT